jgi:hypothetical protein
MYTSTQVEATIEDTVIVEDDSAHISVHIEQYTNETKQMNVAVYLGEMTEPFLSRVVSVQPYSETTLNFQFGFDDSVQRKMSDSEELVVYVADPTHASSPSLGDRVGAIIVREPVLDRPKAWVFIGAGLLFLPIAASVLRRRISEIDRDTKPTTDTSRQRRWSVRRILNEYDPYEFEGLVSNLWSSQGYRTKVTSKSGDGGIDVVAIDKDKKAGIQVKRNSSDNKISSPEINRVYGAASQKNCDEIVFVTTSSFTAPAKKAARKLNRRDVDIILINGRKLVNLLNKYEV